ncbi:hypothetical protein, partial [Xanthomonas fragariae]|uniref:hypothetical protein n=1 Tax=Xanthomonas fragariae TaxID=48664 RepID=UPI003CCED6EC
MIKIALRYACGRPCIGKHLKIFAEPLRIGFRAVSPIQEGQGQLAADDTTHQLVVPCHGDAQASVVRLIYQAVCFQRSPIPLSLFPQPLFCRRVELLFGQAEILCRQLQAMTWPLCPQMRRRSAGVSGHFVRAPPGRGIAPVGG